MNSYTSTLLVACAIIFQTLTPTHALTPEEALASFELHPDFKIELFASEPAIVDPVDLEFDQQGRAFVIEMPGYPFISEPGRVILLEDRDDDGVHESRTVFADDFPQADSLLPYEGGILVASPPDLIFVKDTDGDNVADIRRVLLTGFALENPQHNFNGLTHGLDNWIYGACGGNGGSVYWPSRPNQKTPIRYTDFRMNLREQRFDILGRSTGGFEMALDRWGRYYGTHNMEHIAMRTFHHRYLEGFPSTNTLDQVSDHEENGTARIFSIGVQDTRVNHPEQSGYFSGSCGITYYDGGLFPEEFSGNMFVADVVLNLIHRDILTPNGASMRATRARDRVEFLASPDRAFRPVNMTVGPDGALYVLDMSRDAIEHPEWIPDELEEKLDINAGKNRGRIYRISPKQARAYAPTTFDEPNTDSLVAMLSHPNKWARDTAQRLLVEANEGDSIVPLMSALRNAKEPTARLHALWTLNGLSALDADDVMVGLNDAHPGVRESAVLIAEDWLEARAVRRKVLAMAKDDDPRVRMRVALALSMSDADGSSENFNALFSIARKDLDDDWTRLAVSSALAKNPLQSTQRLLEEDAIARSENGMALAKLLAELAAERESPADLVPLIDQLSRRDTASAALVSTLLDGIADGLPRPDPALSTNEQQLTAALARFFESDDVNLFRSAWRVSEAYGLPKTPRQDRQLSAARTVVLDPNEPTKRREDFLRLYAFEDFSNREDLLFDLLDTSQPKLLQRAAIKQLSDAREDSVAIRVIKNWGLLGPEVIRPAGDILLYQRGNHDRLLTALEQGDLAIGQFNLDLERRRVLLFSRNDDIRTRAEAMFSDAGVVTRREAIESIRPALDLAGDATNGHAVFTELCAQCHRLGPEGTDLGPNLTDIFRKSPETLLHDIIDPNAAVDSEYMAYAIETLNGDFVSGIVIEETDDSVTVREALGKESVFKKSDIEEMYSNGLSMMPEELEIGMEHQKFADLLAFLLTPR